MVNDAKDGHKPSNDVFYVDTLSKVTSVLELLYLLYVSLRESIKPHYETLHVNLPQNNAQSGIRN